MASLLLLGVALGGLLWRLDQGPLSLALIEPLLRPLIERGLPFQVAFAEPTLVWLREEGSVAVQVRDLEVRNPAGELVGGAPRARVVVAVAPLLERRIEPEIVELDLPRLELTREADGGLMLGFAGEITALDLDGKGLGGLLDGAAGEGSGAGPAGLDELRLIRLSAPALVYADVASGQATTASQARLELRRDSGPWVGALSARLGDGRMRATVTAAPGGNRAVRVEVDRFPLQGLQAFLPDLPKVRLELPVTGEVAFTTPPDGFRPGPGRLQLATMGGSLALPENGLGPVPINRAALTARLDPGWRSGRIERFELAANGFTLDATGTVALAGGRPRADLELRARDLDPPEILSLWPQTLAPGARRWVAANVVAGEVGAASLHLGGPPPRPDQRDIGASFAFKGVELRYLPAFPNVTGLAGEAHAAGDTLSFDLTAGSSGEVALSGGKVALTNLVGSGPAGLALTLDVASTVPAALALLDHEPVALGERTGLSMAGTAGRQTTSLELSLPLLDDIPAEKVLYRARTRLADLRLPEVRPGYGLAADAVRLTVAQTGLGAAGDVRVNGVPFTVDWTETFGQPRGVRRIVDLKGRLDAAGAKALRLDWPSPLNGRVGVSLQLSEARQPLRTVDLDLDLGEAGIAIPALLLSKPPGEPGTASARIVQSDAGTVTVEKFNVAAGALAAQGSLGLRLEPLRAERVTLGRLETPLGRGSADLAWRGDAWQGRVDLGDADLRPLRQELRARETGSAPTPIPDFAVDVSARSLRLGDAPLAGLKGRVERRGGIWRAARLRAAIEDSEVTLDLATAARTALTLRANDAGWLIRAFATSDNGVRGGQFRLSADLSQSLRGATGTGELKIRDFTLYGAPLIARIVSLASFSGLSNALSGKGVPVTRLVIPFALEPDRLTITEARLVAADIGARAAGSVDLTNGTLAIDGTVAPAYTINRILGGIPILGQIFSGRGSDAALAATFSVRNTLADPQVAVNPLSVLVPGMIRDLFAALTADAEEPAASRR